MLEDLFDFTAEDDEEYTGRGSAKERCAGFYYGVCWPWS